MPTEPKHMARGKKRVLNRYRTVGYAIVYATLTITLFACSKAVIPPTTSPKTKPYKVLGKWYQPIPDATGFRQRGLAS